MLKLSLLGVHGRLQREGLVIHVVAERLIGLSPRLKSLQSQPRTLPVPLLEPPIARADEVKRPSADQRMPAGVEKSLFPSRDFH